MHPVGVGYVPVCTVHFASEKVYSVMFLPSVEQFAIRYNPCFGQEDPVVGTVHSLHPSILFVDRNVACAEDQDKRSGLEGAEEA